MASAAATELKLIQAVELKIALANNDKVLEKVLAVYLCPLLIKLATPHPANREKVEEILSVVDRRLEGVSQVTLPLHALLTQLETTNIDEAVKNRALLYINRAVPLDSCDSSLFARLTRKYASHTRQQQAIIFHVLCRLLANFELSTSAREDELRTSDFAITDSTQETVLARDLLALMFLDMGQTLMPSETQVQDIRARIDRHLARHGASSSNLPMSANEFAMLRRHQQGPSSTLGTLTRDEVEFLSPVAAVSFTFASLNRLKCGVLRYLSLPVINIAWRYVISLVASFDLNHDVQSQASLLIRRCDVTSAEALYVSNLYDICVNRADLDQRLHSRILSLLAKSKLAAESSQLAQKSIARGLSSKFAKVRSAAIGFLTWIARTEVVAHDTLKTQSTLSQLTRYLSAANNSDDARGTAYVAMGLVCKRDQQFLRDNVEVIASLFNALANEPPAIRPFINDALSDLVHAFIGSSAECLSELQGVLANVICDGPQHTHYAALRMLNNSFDFSHAPARWLCISAVQPTTMAEARQEAHRGLDLHLFSLSRSRTSMMIYPDFQDFVNGQTGHDPMHLTVEARECYVRLARTCLMIEGLSAHQKIDVGQENLEGKLMDTIQFDPIARDKLVATISTWQTQLRSALMLFQKQSLDLYLQHPTPVSAENLLTLLILSQDTMTGLALARVEDFEKLSSFKTAYVRELHSRLYAIVITASDARHIWEKCNSLLSTLQDIHVQALPALEQVGQILTRLHLRGHTPQLDLAPVINFLQQGVLSKDPNIVRACVDCCNMIGFAGQIPDAARSILCASLLQLHKKQASDSAISERLALALAALSMTCGTDSTELRSILDSLMLETKLQPKVEHVIARGEAIACVIGRWECRALQNRIDVPCSIVLEGARPELVRTTIDELLSYMNAEKPQQRRGACLKLVSIIQLLNTKAVNEKLTATHSAFLSLLADHDEYVVESANKGIQIVYERCDQGLKDELLAQLFSTMTSDTAARANNPTLTAETEIFRPDSIAVGTGANESSVSTYKDICNLAIEAGNSSLVYSFLSLASSSSMWSTRRGVALGLGSLLSKQGAESILNKSPELLQRLLPKLFRYKHDPATRVARSMETIFQQLFPDEKTAIEQNFALICAELCKALSDQAWRVRESSARAMISLISGRTLASMSFDLDQIWNLALRVLDDVKESVRLAGIDLCQSLANQIIKAIDSGPSTKKAKQVLEIVLPLLLRHLRSLSADVSSFALKTLLRITKESGESIKQFLPVLVDEYLQLTSTMEPEMMNYLSFHAAKYNITQSDLDNHRLASMRSSPLIDALEQCIDKMDESSMQETVPRLCQIIRQTSGLPTKAATSRFLISLTARAPHLLRPHADVLLQALSSGLKDRSQAVVQASASCIGYLARLASAEKLVKLVNYISVPFFKGEDENNALALVLKGIAQNANDKFNTMASVFYPLCFLAMHDPQEETGKLFRGIWEDNTGSAQALKLYLPEILPLLEEHLLSPAWRIKQMSANTIADIAEKLDLGTHKDRVLKALVSALKGKSWVGKEAVLKALVALFSRYQETLSPDQLLEIKEIMLREARRTNLDYKRHALVHLTTFVSTYCAENMFPAVLEIVEDWTNPNAMDQDAEDISLPFKLVLVQNSLHCLISAFNPRLGTVDEYRTILTHAMHQAGVQPWNVKSQISRDLQSLFQRMTDSRELWTLHDVRQTWTFLTSLGSDQSYQSLREEAVKSMSAFITACKAQKVRNEQMSIMAQDVQKMLADEPSTIIQAMLKALPW